jgi:Arc/MetJ-type ribon-helix-helix transcriptional regulator
MQNITINIPEQYYKKIKELIERELIASQSEFIRCAIQEFLKKELKFIEVLE